MRKDESGLKNSYATLSFDIEDWFQVESMKSKFPIKSWEHQDLRVVESTQKILDLLGKHQVQGTFFILGWIAEKVPGLIEKIYKSGHEIASHGYSHKLNYKMTHDELFEDLKYSKKLLEDITGETVYGYRAPTFSINDDVVRALVKIGYRYDSSWNKFATHDRYGRLEDVTMKKMKDHSVFLLNEKLTELCLPVEYLLSKSIPIAGGGFFRLYPLWFSKLMFKKYMTDHNYYMFYSHPWEFDTEQPKIKEIGWSNRLRHYINLDNNTDKIDAFIKYLKELNVEIITAKEYLFQSKQINTKGEGL